ncbi:MAG: signal peptidase II [Puniceicoccales bacterium]|jgi:lipoprotein signal peptidase|nr:signal peptidase II [Puniceicoccales bacterium]
MNCNVALSIIFGKRHLFNIYQQSIAFDLFLARMTGNVVDRVCYGFIINFIGMAQALQIGRWSTLNIANLVLCISIITLLIINR